MTRGCRYRLWGGLVLLPLIVACSTISAEQLQREVSDKVAYQLTRPTGWEQGGPDDRSVQVRVVQLLEAPLMIEQAVAVALLNNRDLRALLSRLEITRGDMVQAGLLDNPVFSVSLLSGNNGTEVEYALLANFLDLITLAARRNMAVVQLERARLAVAHAVLDLVADVKRTYFDLLADRQAMVLYSDALELAEAAAELAQRQYAAGTVGAREQAKRQARMVQAALEARRAETRYRVGRESLNRLLGLHGEEIPWELPLRWPDPPEALPASDGLVQQATSLRLDQAARKAELETARMGLAFARRTRWLSVLGVGLRLKRDESGNYSRGPGLTLGLPLFNRGQGRIVALEAEQTEAEYRYVQGIIDIRAEVRQAVARLDTAHDAVERYQNDILPLADRVVAETLLLYNGMLVDVYALLEAKQAQIDAQRDFVAATRDFWRAWVDLERALGGALPRPTVDVAPDGLGQGRPGDDQGGPER